MKTRIIFGMLLTALISTVGLTSCEKEGKKITGEKIYAITVASERRPGLYTSDGIDCISDVYAVKKNGETKWESLHTIKGFDYEPGYEYTVRIKETSYLDYSMDEPAWTEYSLDKLLSKEKKDSEGLPESLIPKEFYNDCGYMDESSMIYAIDADNAEVIEDELKGLTANDEGLRLYISPDGHWILLDAGKEFKGYGLVVGHDPMETIPDAYTPLMPEVKSATCKTLDFMKPGTTSEILSQYDLLISADGEWTWLFNDLTSYFQERFPAADINSVAVRYTLRQ